MTKRDIESRLDALESKSRYADMDSGYLYMEHLRATYDDDRSAEEAEAFFEAYLAACQAAERGGS